MEKMKKYIVKIKGITPLIYNRMKKENLDELKKIKKTELNEWEEKNWLKKAEINNGNAVMPPEWFKSMLINSAMTTRLIPHFETNKKATYTRYVTSSVVIDNTPIVCKKTELKGFGKFMSAQGDKGGAKVWRIRPMVEKWGATIELTDIFGRMREDELKELLEFGGSFIGIGDGRIDRFGRFEVENIKAK